MLTDDVLALLADGEYHSGQNLADAQSVSRTAIWKHIQTIADLGVQVERVRGRGYRVPGGLELLDSGLIRGALSSEAADALTDLSILRSVDSTNAELQRRSPLTQGATVCLAERQTAGRGRRGRAWVSPFGSSIYASTAWRFASGAAAFEGLSLVVGVLVCRALTELGIDGLALKWPNDVLRHGRKLAGILVEMSGDVSGPCTAVIGIGINVAMPTSAIDSIDQPWADLRAPTGTFPSRNKLVSALLNQLLPALDGYERAGFASWRDEWHSLDAYARKSVLIHSASKSIAGVADGVDERGALLLQTGNGVHRVHGGEVSLRLAE
ncbi:MAG: bifunctional biotin--[acetyl-CoA-carboxylase] ligase/biotin operon repressor BirA [Congregibacter sp.]